MKAVATLLVLGIIAAGCGEGRETSVSSQATLHRVTLPTLPKSVLHKFRRNCREVGCAQDGVGVDANGDILVAVQEADECCYLYGLIRFDPRQRRWMPGGIVNPTVPGSTCAGGCLAEPTSLLPVGQTVWMKDPGTGYPQTPKAVYRGRFSNGWTIARKIVRAQLPARSRHLWFCEDIGEAKTVTFVDPRTGHSTKLKDSHGTSLLQAVHGGMWVVRGKPWMTNWSNCQS